MSKEKINKIFDILTKTLVELQNIINEGADKPTTSNEEVSSESIDLLGVKLAYAYTTRHPEYNVDSQIRNLKEMIAGNKISYIISWLRKGNIMGIEGFLTLDTTTQRMLLDKAVCAKEEEIKKIFNERFKCK